MLKESNIRYGVVNVKMRAKYEKEFQVSYGYDYMKFKKQEAISYCKVLNDPNFIVERIFDTTIDKNFKEEIFKSGSFKEGGNEKDN